MYVCADAAGAALHTANAKAHDIGLRRKAIPIICHS
jgi:hypothetical protein